MATDEALIARVNSWLAIAERDLNSGHMAPRGRAYYGFINALRNVLKLLKD